MEEKVNFIRKKDPTFLFHFSFFIPKTYVTSLIFVSYRNQMSNDRKTLVCCSSCAIWLLIKFFAKRKVDLN